MKFTPRMWTALLVAALFLLAGMAFSLSTYRQIRATALAQQQTLQLLKSADDFLSALKDAETGQRGYVITGNEAFLQPYLAVKDSIQARLEQLQQLAHVDGNLDSLPDLASLVHARMDELAQVIDLRRAHNNAEVLARVSDGRGKQLMDTIRARVKAFTEQEEGTLARHEAD